MKSSHMGCKKGKLEELGSSCRGGGFFMFVHLPVFLVLVFWYIITPRPYINIWWHYGRGHKSKKSMGRIGIFG